MQRSKTSNHELGRKSGKSPLRWLVLVAGLGLAGALGGTAAVIGAYYYVEPELPATDTIADIPLQIPLRVYTRDGYLISEIGERRRYLVNYEDIPPQVINAFVAAEDRRFFEHPGFDYQGILRAFVKMLQSGKISGGGSTLTQQLARDYFLNRDLSFTRKLREVFLAYNIEQQFTKQQIITLFLNKMFFGQRAYGVAAAAQVYFNKDLKDINIAEAATLAGVLPAPSLYNPVRSATLAKGRRDYVLGRMHNIGYINDSEYADALALPVESALHGANVELNAPYVAEMVRREMLKRYGDATYTAGYEVVTTLDSKMQRAATHALRNGLLEFTRRHGYRGPIAHVDVAATLTDTPASEWPADIRDLLNQYVPGGLSVALVTSVNANNSVGIVFADGHRATVPWRGLSWAKRMINSDVVGAAPKSAADVLSIGDVIDVMPAVGDYWALAQIPRAQSALVSVDPSDAAISALVGGFDFTASKFNRATQAYRQPGSSFKPFIYSAAIAQGNTPATVVLDAPVVINSSELEAVWRPINYSGKFYGPTRMREALVRSMNLVSVRLLLFHTGIGNAIKHIEKFGFGDAALPRNGSLALGSGAASPLDMAQGYAVLANGGYAVKPYLIDAIYGPDGSTLYRANPPVVCVACETDDAPSAGGDKAGDTESAMPVEKVADVAMSYRATPAQSPELFSDINAAPRAISVQNAYLIQDMMRDVIRRGTGRRALQLGRKDLSGKTGTSNDRRDAWFGGFNSDLVTVVWVGFDDDQPLGAGEEGSRTALPIWIDFNRVALAGAPEHSMPMPKNIVSVLIDKQTGCPSRAGQADVMFEVFIAGHEPKCDSAESVPDIFNAGSDSNLPARDKDKDSSAESLF